jgi:archaellum component FlaG (FlaF/FlaG flagellin family)
MLRSFLLFIIVVNFTSAAWSAEVKGVVCLGKNLAKSLDEHSDRLHLKVDDSHKIVFKHPYSGPTVVADNLDLDQDHEIAVYFDGRIVQSWRLNFSVLNTESVLIWRASGSWRMEPNRVSECRQQQK